MYPHVPCTIDFTCVLDVIFVQYIDLVILSTNVFLGVDV